MPRARPLAGQGAVRRGIAPVMLKIRSAEYRGERVIRITFSDGTGGDYDLRELVARGGEMVGPLADRQYFQGFFLQLGALCWPNGFELSATGIRMHLLSHPLIHARPKTSVNVRCPSSISPKRCTSGRSRSSGIVGISS